MAAQYHGKELSFVGVNIWDQEEKARSFVKERGIEYFVGRDFDNAIAKAYGIQGTPTTFFLDKDGRIVSIHEGAMKEADLVKGIKALLKK